MPLFKIIFCYNQVSYVLAKRMKSIGKQPVFLINSDVRITRTAKVEGIFEFDYQSALALVAFVFSIIPGIVEIVIPHTRGGKIVTYIAKYCYRLSFVDDGMDSFRTVPKNLNPDIIRPDSIYYTFNYKLPYAEWLRQVKKEKLTEVNTLEIDVKPKIDLNEYETLIIESPGVNLSKLEYDSAKTFCIKHPNPNKSGKDFQQLNGVSGKQISLEKSLSDFKGRVVIGETMVLVYLIHQFKNLSQLTVCLTKKDYDNLNCLHEKLNECGRLILT